MLFVYTAAGDWSRTGMTLIERNVENNHLVVSYRHAARDNVVGVASFALLAPQVGNGVPTALPTPSLEPTPTKLPSTELDQQIYLPLINGQ